MYVVVHARCTLGEVCRRSPHPHPEESGVPSQREVLVYEYCTTVLDYEIPFGALTLLRRYEHTPGNGNDKKDSYNDKRKFRGMGSEPRFEGKNDFTKVQGKSSDLLRSFGDTYSHQRQPPLPRVEPVTIPTSTLKHATTPNL